jgi:antitoxin component of MazEF toxin-antitoxin module
MTTITKQFSYLILTFLTLVAGYAYLRYAYKVTDSTPFTQEIVLIILGTIATVFITALLLNKQTAVEIEKEQNIKFLDLKAQTYEKLLDLMEDMASQSSFNEADITKLQFVTHRLAIFASPSVLNEYTNFLNVVSQISKDGTFSNDTEQLSDALGKLTIEIRFDLLGENESQKAYSIAQIKNMIKKNSHSSSHINID